MASAAAAFQDDLGWATGGAFPSDAAGGLAAPSAGGKVLASDDFLDFDDDDGFFSSATGGAAGAGTASAANKSASQSATSATSSFGMSALAYQDVATSARSMRGSVPRPTSPTFGLDGDDDMGDDDELKEMDRKYLIQLRNPGSSHRAVASSCLMLHQLLCSTYPHNQANACVSSASNSPPPLQAESSSLFHVQQHQRRIHRIISSLTDCLQSHELQSCRILACRTLAAVARASFARLRFDARLETEPVRHPAITQLEDECGSGAAYSLVVAAIEQADDAVSSAALEALGRLTLDPHTDNLAAEVRGIAENASSNVFHYEDGSKSSWILGHAEAMKELQSKAWEHVVFPRMQTMLQRLSLYSSPHLLAKTIPVVTAAFVHALTQGSDTMPSRRALQAGKESHGKRGWREVDAEGMAAEFVEGVLLPCFVEKHPFRSNETLQRAMAVAFLRLSSAAPHASWRPSACRHAVTVLLQQLNEGMAATTPLNPSFTLEKAGPTSPISSTIAPAAVPVESLAGTAAFLVVAVRGIPLHERAPGLVAVLKAALRFLPMGVSFPSGAGSLDLPLGVVQGGGQASQFRLGRTGLLTEVALSVMLDGASNTGAQNGGTTGTVTRSLLMQRILESKQLAPVWDESKKGDESTFMPADELVWAFCHVATQIGEEREQLLAKDLASASEWSNLGLVLLDSFASIISVPGSESKSPFAKESRAAYNRLFAALLKSCGALPPSALSISERVLPGYLDNCSINEESPVEGRQMDHFALALSKISTKLLFLRDKAKISTGQKDASAEASFQFTELTALLVDAWSGRCIANHDAKQSNKDQLGAGLTFLPLCHAEVHGLLQKHRSVAQESDVTVAAYLCRILIACLEHVACMSGLLANALEGEAPGQDVGPMAVSMLNEIITSAKEGDPIDTKQGAKLRYQVALDASHAISRITERASHRPKSLPEDITAAFQVSPLVAGIGSKPSLSSLNRSGPVENCTCIELHEKGKGEAVLLPIKSTRWKTAVVSGCSDPVSVNTSWDIRRMRTSGSSEKATLVITVKVFNITPVPIRNGIRIDMNVEQETQGTHGHGSSCTASQDFKNEIQGNGDCVTWQVVLGLWRPGPLSLSVAVSFRDMQQEPPSKTHKVVTPGMGDNDVPSEAEDDYDDDSVELDDVTISFVPVTISPITTLQPCPLVFFGGLRRCKATLGCGDEASFKFLWRTMDKGHHRTIPFAFLNGAIKTLRDTKMGHVVLSSSPEGAAASLGCAYMDPHGNRLLCVHQTNRDGTHSLTARSDSSELLGLICGTPERQTALLQFMFGSEAQSGQASPSKPPATGHDFPSMTMPHHPPIRA
ncbi:hypothetical protein ACHAXT_010095 [Thalassiosira profunda]